jgi:sulfite exporter TauE/SafE
MLAVVLAMLYGLVALAVATNQWSRGRKGPLELVQALCIGLLWGLFPLGALYQALRRGKHLPKE